MQLWVDCQVEVVRSDALLISLGTAEVGREIRRDYDLTVRMTKLKRTSNRKGWLTLSFYSPIHSSFSSAAFPSRMPSNADRDINGIRD